MRLYAVDRDVKLLDAGDGADHCQRQAFIQQIAALLDVHFHERRIAGRVDLAVGDAVGVGAHAEFRMASHRSCPV